MLYIIKWITITNLSMEEIKLDEKEKSEEELKGEEELKEKEVKEEEEEEVKQGGAPLTILGQKWREV